MSTGSTIYLALVVVFLIVVGALLYRLFTASAPKECNHIYMLYSPTASACALCGKEHPQSNKMPTLNRNHEYHRQLRHWR